MANRKDAEQSLIPTEVRQIKMDVAPHVAAIRRHTGTGAFTHHQVSAPWCVKAPVPVWRRMAATCGANPI